MNAKKIITLLLALVLAAGTVACGAKQAEGNEDTDKEPQTAEEAAALYDELMAQENAIQAENTELWEKLFLSADKGMATTENGKNYGEFLLSTIEAAKEQFTDEEYELLKEKATEIKNIEDRLAALEEKFPSLSGTPAEDGGMSVPAGSDTTTPPDDGSTVHPSEMPMSRPAVLPGLRVPLPSWTPVFRSNSSSSPVIVAGTRTLADSCLSCPMTVYTAYTAGLVPKTYCSGSSSVTDTSPAVRPSANSSRVPGSVTVTMPSGAPPPATVSSRVRPWAGMSV